MLEGRIAELEVAIANAWVQEAPSDGTIGVGSKIVVRDSDGEEDHYTLVGSAEANPRGGLISVESPVGQALLRAQKGDKVQVETPSGHREIEVLEVK